MVPLASRLGVGVHRLAVFSGQGLQNCRLLAIGLGGLRPFIISSVKPLSLPQGGAAAEEGRTRAVCTVKNIVAGMVTQKMSTSFGAMDSIIPRDTVTVTTV